jgi:hypothetical protein
MKEVECKWCGKKFLKSKHTDPKNCLCDECKAKGRKKICPVCGREYLTRQGCTEFCKKHSRAQLKALADFGFDLTTIGTERVESEFDRIRNEIDTLYWKEHLSSKEIIKKFGYKHQGNFTSHILHYLDIKSKTLSESVEENFETGRKSAFSSPTFKSGWHETWNGKRVFLRSSYEEDYASLLDEQKIDYEVEQPRIVYWDSIKKKRRIAIPDFWLKSSNSIVEIKSSFTLDRQNMIDRLTEFERRGFETKLMLDHKEVDWKIEI